ncbi:SWIM zinc finger family protein [Streptomyces sp. NBC_00728]
MARAGAGEPADGTDEPRPVTGERPADAARRALRAARDKEREERERRDGRETAATDEHSSAVANTGVAGGAGAVGGSGAGAGASAAREAVTRTSSMPSTPVSSSGVPAPSEASRSASTPGTRPSDAAREALRRATASAKAADTPSDTASVTGSDTASGTGSVTGSCSGACSGAGASARGASGVPESCDAPLPATDGEPDAGSGPDPAGASAELVEATEPVESTEAAATARSVTEDTGSTQPDHVGRARPGDIAREALRAARDEAKRVRAESADDAGGRATGARRKGAGPGSRSARTSSAGSRERRGPVRPVSAERASQERDLRDLLASAFRLPPDVADVTGHPSDPADDTGEATHDRDHDLAADLARPVRPGPERETSALPEPFAPGSLDPETFLPARPRPGDPAATARSMASPGRDGELRRTFPAFPARVREAGGFAETWWGNAWVTALEEGALDAARLARGRTYAGQGYVDAITVTPGLVLAYVHGSRPRPYRVQVRVRTLTDDDWDRFLDVAADRPGHIAALLDKEMPRSLADCGVELLPGPGELEPHCSCPDFGHPCKHAAALCYQTARLLDQDPFVLFLLRGRGERELLDALSRRNAARAARAAQDRDPAPLPGVRARDALARRVLPALPAPLPPPAHPEQPPTYPGAPGGPDPFALDQLATDAAARAHALLTSGRDPVADLTLWQDAVRLAAARPGSGLTAATRALYSSLASATGRTPADLARAVAAWRQGGFEALSVLEEVWDPPAGRFDRARPLLMAADFPAFRPWRNHLTHPRGHAQLRLGRNGLWYAYESEPGHDDWWPRGTPDLDPVGALTGLGAPGEL